MKAFQIFLIFQNGYRLTSLKTLPYSYTRPVCNMALKIISNSLCLGIFSYKVKNKKLHLKFLQLSGKRKAAFQIYQLEIT